MSVINKMLQDLERRGAPASPSASLADNAPAFVSRKNVRLPLYIGLALLLVVLVVWLFMLAKSPQPADFKLSGDSYAAVEQPVLPLVMAVSDTVIAPIQIPTHIPIAKLAPEPKSEIEIVQAPEVLKRSEPDSDPINNNNNNNNNNINNDPVLGAPVKAKQLTPAVVITKPDTPQSQLSIARHTESAAAVAQRLLSEARQAEQNGQLTEAIRLLQQLQQQQPAELPAYLQLARIYNQQQQWQTARQWLLQALSLGLEQPEVYFMLASLAAAQLDWLQALAHLPARFELAGQPDYYGLKAAILQQLGRPADAYFWYRQLHVLQPTQARWSLGAAVVLEQQQQQRAARYYFQQALAQRQSLSAASVDYIQQRLAATEP